MKSTHKLILGLSVVAFLLCAVMTGAPGSGSPQPTPTRTMAEGVIELAKIYRTPTGDSLIVNLAWLGIKDQQWSARPRDSDWDWLVTLNFTLNGKPQAATWVYRVDLNQLAPIDPVARFFFNNR